MENGQTVRHIALALCAVFVSVLWNVNARASLIGNGSFETPQLAAGRAQYQPSGGVWSFNPSAGIINPPGAVVPGQGDFDGYPAPDGAQYAFLQSGSLPLQGAISQDVVFPATGLYSLTWWEAGRSDREFPGHGGNNPYIVELDSATLGSFASTTGERFTARALSFTASAGTHTLAFAAKGTIDNTTFIDQIDLAPAATGVPLPPAFGFGIIAAGVAMAASPCIRRLGRSPITLRVRAIRLIDGNAGTRHVR
jgi:hypothetical protein